MQYLLLGVVLIIAGFLMMINPEFYSSRFSMTFDYTNIKYPLSMMLITVGLLLAYSFLRKKKE